MSQYLLEQPNALFLGHENISAQKSAFAPYLKHHAIVEYACSFDVSLYSDELLKNDFIDPRISFERMVAKRKAELVAGRYCASRCLASLNTSSLIVGVNDDRSPQWPDGVVGSISHNATTAICIATDHPNILGLGIDVESILDEHVVKGIMDKILNSDEIALYESRMHKQFSLDRFVSVIFSAKESIYKALYPTVKKCFGFDAVSLMDINDDQLHFQINYSLHPDFNVGQALSVGFSDEALSVVTWVMIEEGAVE